MMPFDLLFPEEAENECRSITPINHEGLPDRTFILREFYCTDPSCDCRRVVLAIFDADQAEQVATINYAFEPPEPPYEDEGQVFLDPLNPQSSMSEALLDLFEEMIANDENYRARLVRHYEMWKRVVDDPTHPDHAKVRTDEHDDPSFEPAFPRRKPIRRDRPKVGANERCPCGSGKKYKKCCRARDQQRGGLDDIFRNYESSREWKPN
jgi:hypothetical protein